MARRPTVPALALAVAAALACRGSSTGSADASSDARPDAGAVDAGTHTAARAAAFQITIATLRFSPLDLHVPPGATIVVVNADALMHTVTSEARAGAFAPGEVNGISFDTGEIPPGQRRTVKIPATAPPGTRIPYYCAVRSGSMVTPDGVVTVDPDASPPR